MLLWFIYSSAFVVYWNLLLWSIVATVFCGLVSGRLTTYPRGCPRSEHEWFPLFHCIAVYCCLLGLFGFIVVYWVLFLFIVFYWGTPHQLLTNSLPTLFGLLVCIVIYWVLFFVYCIVFKEGIIFFKRGVNLFLKGGKTAKATGPDKAQ